MGFIGTNIYVFAFLHPPLMYLSVFSCLHTDMNIFYNLKNYNFFLVKQICRHGEGDGNACAVVDQL